MSKKDAGLSAELVAVKGKGEPVKDITNRGGKSVKLAGGPEPLNFRVSLDFRKEFKTYAAQNNLKLNELLFKCFEAYKVQQEQKEQKEH